ncbi:hypothetical protein ACFSJS_16840 [Streptomyces desertarenae]|uniref:Uncharacterized protein n=1 Tax=Streptomyces desertarenae TaxID=2666184 RepID=A0ABW4PKS5_9ACTN
MNKKSLMSRTAVVLAALGAVTAGVVPQVQAAQPHTAATAVRTASQGELFPELNGMRIKAADSGDIHLVLDGRRHLIPSSVTHGALFRGTDGIRLVLTADNIADGGPLTAYAHLARSADDPTVYLVSNGHKREITPAAMDRYAFDWQKVRTTYPEVLAALPAAAPLI